jgi:hypothetical protein
MGKIISILVVVVLLLFGSWFYWKYFYTYSDGNRTGLLQKFSHKGNMFKTYEGELILNSIVTNQATLSSEKFYFSVADEEVAKKLMNYEGQKVVLHYEQKNGRLFWRGDSEYIVDSVKPASQ